MLVFLSHLHGDRGQSGKGATGEGSLCLDTRSFSILQERTDGMEKLGPAQSQFEQVFSQSRKSSRKFVGNKAFSIFFPRFS